jgi:hypothetical protein
MQKWIQKMNMEIKRFFTFFSFLFQFDLKGRGVGVGVVGVIVGLSDLN